MSLGSRIYEQRAAHGLSQVDLADLLEVSRQSVSKWETDASVPDLDKLVKMCEVFVVSLDWLVIGKDSPAPRTDSRTSTQTIAGLILLAVGALAFLTMTAVMTVIHEEFDCSAGILLGLPLLACGGLCFLLHKKPLLLLGCGWVVCISLAFYLLITEEDLMFSFNCFLGNVYGDIEEYLPAGFLTFLDLIGFITLCVISLMYDQIFPPEDKKKT